MMRSLQLILIVTIVFLSSGCAIKGNYNHDYIAHEIKQDLQKNTDLSMVIFTVKALDESKFMGKYNQANGQGISAVELELPVGLITREITYEFFKQYFSKVEKVSDEKLLEKNGYQIVLIPATEAFYYEPVAMFATAGVRFKLHIIINKNNKTVFNKIYDSGLINGEMSIMTSSLQESANKTFHKGLFNLYKIINKDIALVIANEWHAKELK